MSETVKYYLLRLIFPAAVLISAAIAVFFAVKFEAVYSLFVLLVISGIFSTKVLEPFGEFLSVLARESRVEDAKRGYSELKGVYTNSGPPRSGKSSEGGEAITIHAAAAWQNVVFKRKQYALLVDEFREAGDKKKLREWRDLNACYNFWTSHPEYIPCFASNVPMFVDGKKTMPLYAKHLQQKERLPPYTNLFIDESSFMIDTDLYKIRPQDVDEMFRFIGHFLGDNVLIVVCEQDATKSYIGIKRSVAFNQFMIGQVWANKPIRLLKRLAKLKAKFMKSENPKQSEAERLLTLDERASRIGYREYHYVRAGSTQNNFIQPSGEQILYLPSKLDYSYDDRVYQELYQSKDAPLNISSFAGDDLLTKEYRNEILRYVKEPKETKPNAKKA